MQDVNEWVLVTPAQLVTFQGLSKATDILPLLLSNSFYVPRAEAEEDERLKQLIPYAVLIKGREVFRYQRGVKGGEGRLHGLWSVGVGGHVNPVDGEGGDAYDAAFLRELAEEVDCEVKNQEVVALINDDSTPVGKVHLGVVHIVKIGLHKFGIKEKSLESGEFVHQLDIKQVHGEYESWSKLVVENLL